MNYYSPLSLFCARAQKVVSIPKKSAIFKLCTFDTNFKVYRFLKKQSIKVLPENPWLSIFLFEGKSAYLLHISSHFSHLTTMGGVKFQKSSLLLKKMMLVSLQCLSSNWLFSTQSHVFSSICLQHKCNGIDLGKERAVLSR